MYRAQSISRVFRASEYESATPAPIGLTRLTDPGRFEPVQIGRTPWPSNDDLESIRERAHKEGYEAGRARAAEEAASQRQRDGLAIAHLLEGLAKPFDDLNDEVAGELASLALQMAAALAGQQLALEPQLLIPIVREAVDALPSHARQVNVSLHPEDIEWVSQRLQNELDHVTFVADRHLNRGDCVVRSEASTVDAGLNARLERLCQSLPGLKLESGPDTP